MLDSHCHLNFQAFADDADSVANAMRNDKVGGLIVGCDLASSRYAIEIANNHSHLFASVGLHPIHVLDEEFDFQLMSDLALDKKVVAIGEVGLDNYRLPDKPEIRQNAIDTQIKVFQAAIELSNTVNKPLVIHSRESMSEVIAILKEHNTTPLQGTVHCFMGNLSEAETLIELGFMIGFTGVITYKDVNPDLLSVVDQIPLNRILIETDAPYLTPEPIRSAGKKNTGKVPRNLPQYVIEVAEFIAKRRHMPVEEIVQISQTNALKLFRIEKLNFQ